MKKIRIFNLFRYLAIAAIICTVALGILIFALCATPGDESAAQSQAVADSIESAVSKGDGKDAIAVTRIELHPASFQYVGQTTKLKVDFLPEGAAEEELVYDSSNNNVLTIDEDGMMTFVSCGEATVSAKLKSDETISASCPVACIGTKDIGEIVAVDGFNNIKEGTTFRVNLADAEGNRQSSYCWKADIADKTILEKSQHVWIAKKAGTTKVTFTKEGYEPYVVNVNVAENPSGVPKSFVVESEVINLEYLKKFKLADIVSSEPAGIAINGENCTLSLKNLNPNGPASVDLVTRHTLTAVDTGKTELTVTSIFNPDCTIKVILNVPEPVPTELRIVGDSWATVDTAYAYNAIYNGAHIYDVRWDVVRGKAEISENGVIRPTRLGKLTIRVTSNADPSVYADIDIQVSLFQSFGLFVRKILGHFMLFAILGFGLLACYFFLMKPRALSPLFAAATGLLAAIISEVLQMPIFTPGRYASWTDVGIDFIGVLLGIAVGLAVILLYYLIRGRSENYIYAKLTIKNLTIKSLFSKAANMPLYSTYEYSRDGDSPAPQTEAQNGDKNGNDKATTTSDNAAVESEAAADKSDE